MVNILENEVWLPEPALKPEDELILRKLHDMLQSTADDLKVLSGELTKQNQPGIQIKSLSTPLDKEFNEKIHIEEMVNAKFNGYKIIQKPTPSDTKINKVIREIIAEKNVQIPKVKSTGIQVTLATKPIETILRSRNNCNVEHETIHQSKIELTSNKLGITTPNPAVAYKEISYNYIETDKRNSQKKVLHIQEMPSVNIRSALIEQKVVQLDIKPKIKLVSDESSGTNQNIATIEIKHENPVKLDINLSNTSLKELCETIHKKHSKRTIRKVSKMSTCESSDSFNITDTDCKTKSTQIFKNATQKQTKKDVSKKPLLRDKAKDRHTRLGIEGWKKKLNTVYSKPSTSQVANALRKTINKNPELSKVDINKKLTAPLNNTEYIPYSKLTLGGVKIKDVEREISDIPFKNDIPLSPILDKILCKESSFNGSLRSVENDPKILTTSDENLLQEVLDIGRNVSRTISNNFGRTKTIQKKVKDSEEFTNISEVKSNESNNYSYDDDFEDDDNTDNTPKEQNIHTSNSNSNTDNESKINKDSKNQTFIKSTNLSVKNTVDVFEFVHSVDTRDNATQSNMTQKKSLKETQTSPRDENTNMRSIHNNLWPSIDPNGEVEHMFTIEKELIKKVILEEYGNLLENTVGKPSSSKADKSEDERNNSAAIPKNTQTSPAKVKSSMTSPKRTKNRSTSPFPLTLKINRETSPLNLVSNEEGNECKVGLSVNLSSPRFSLRLPQTSREGLTLDNSQQRDLRKDTTFIKAYPNSSSADVEVSSSDLSSLGEVKLRLRRKHNRRGRIATISESSSTSTVSKSSEDILSGILPLRSEGETSIKVIGKSEGEVSVGQLKSEGEISSVMM